MFQGTYSINCRIVDPHWLPRPGPSPAIPPQEVSQWPQSQIHGQLHAPPPVPYS